ncbi:uncharacterized protein [Centruroides vittatus]|uniref:uncharacterized protein n=1 Tax=Centruroides vittatus TaxID=120091 RepID=UPI00350EBEFF
MLTNYGILIFSLFFSVHGAAVFRSCGRNEAFFKRGCEYYCHDVLNFTCTSEMRHPGCFCDFFYLRDKDRNVCITEKECSDRVCPKPNTEISFFHEFVVCAGDGEAHFGYVTDNYARCCCKRGYAENKEKECIPISECTG